MRTHSHILRIGAPLLCVVMLLANAQCGEYLFLHYLFTQNCRTPNDGSETESPAGTQPPTTPAVVVEVLTPCIVEDQNLEAVPLEDGPGGPQPPSTCQDADLNGDGKVDALDIQIMVNCLLAH